MRLICMAFRSRPAALHCLEAGRDGGHSSAGEVDELDGLVSSLRAQCPVTDNLAQSGAMQGGAASLGNGHDAQQAHAETPVSCLQVHPFVLMGMLPVPTDSVLVMRLANSERPLYQNCVLKSP